MPKHKHLNLDNRQIIESMLNNKESISTIAEKLGKSVSTISREITKHVVFVRNGIPGRAYNNCKNRYICTKIEVCETCTSPKHYKYCSRCSICNKMCSDYVAEVCSRYEKPPYVCNGCGNRIRYGASHGAWDHWEFDQSWIIDESSNSIMPM